MHSLLLSQFQMNKNKIEICEFEMHLKIFFCLRSNLSNEGLEGYFWDSGFDQNTVRESGKR